MKIIRASDAAKAATEANRTRRDKLLKDSGAIWLMNKIDTEIKHATRRGKASELIDIKNNQMTNGCVVSDEILDAICWHLTAIGYEIRVHHMEFKLGISWGDKSF